MAINLFGDDSVKKANRERLSKPSLASQRQQGGKGGAQGNAAQGAVLGGEPTFLKGVSFKPTTTNGNLVAPKGEQSPIPNQPKSTNPIIPQEQSVLSRPYTNAEVVGNRTALGQIADQPKPTRGFGTSGEGTLRGGNLNLLGGQTISADQVRSSSAPAQNVFQDSNYTPQSTSSNNGIGFGTSEGIQSLAQEYEQRQAQRGQDIDAGNRRFFNDYEAGKRKESYDKNISDLNSQIFATRDPKIKAALIEQKNGLASDFLSGETQSQADFAKNENSITLGQQELQANQNEAVARAQSDAAKLGLDYAKLSRQQQQDLVDQNFKGIEAQQAERKLNINEQRLGLDAVTAESEAKRREDQSAIGLGNLQNKSSELKNTNTRKFIDIMSDPTKTASMPIQQKIALAQQLGIDPSIVRQYLSPEDLISLGATVAK